MVSVTATEFQNNVGRYNDLAMRDPVMITKQGRETLVLLSVEEYNRMKQFEETVLTEEKKALIRERLDVHSHTIHKLAE